MGNLTIKTQLLHLIEQGITFDVSQDKLLVKGELAKLDDKAREFLIGKKREIISLIQQQRQIVSPAIAVKEDGADQQLSFAQSRLWLLDKISDGSVQYNIPMAMQLDGKLDQVALNKALSTIVKRHESLRTCFTERDNGQAYPIVQKPSDCEAIIEDLTGLNQDHKQQRIGVLMKEEASGVFDLSQDHMLRARLLLIDEKQHILLVTMHHIASDGWSMEVLLKEFSALYSAYAQEQPDPLPQLAIQYADYAHWQHQWLQGSVLEQQLDYWQNHLADLPTAHSLPLDKPRPQKLGVGGAMFRSRISNETLNNLMTLCQAQGATLFMGLHAAFSVLLSRCSNEKDIVVGTPVANREQVEIADLIGFFVNILVLRSDLSTSPSFTTLVKQSKTTLLDAYAHQQVPFEKIVERLQPQRSSGHSPLFQIMLVLHNNPINSLTLPDLTLTPLEQETEFAKYDLTLNITQTTDGLVLDWEHNTELFATDSIARLSGYFETLLNSLLAAPDDNVFAVDMLPKAEREHWLSVRKEQLSPPAAELCLHQLFEQQAQRFADEIALIYDQEQLSYSELNQRANQLAHYLRNEKGVCPDSLVGLCVERSSDMVVGMLAILKAGGAYVPLDPHSPAARLEHMLKDAELNLVLTQQAVLESTSLSSLQSVCLDDAGLCALLAEQSKDNLPSQALGLKPSHLAYVIYTSGSTGQPKGVMVEHQNVVRLFSATDAEFAFDNNDVWCLFHSFAFDFSVWEIWGALSKGGRLVVVPYWVSRSPDQFYRLLVEHQVTVLNQTPSAFNHIIAQDKLHSANVLALRYVIFGGEALNLTALRPWFDKYGDDKIQFINMYGITETTVHVTFCRLTRELVYSGSGASVIGSPIADLDILILNEHQSLVPNQLAGEMYVGGPGLSRGYLNNPKLTDERFLELVEFDNKRYYRTGDMARLLANGELEYLGRSDEQVKIRGFRIELGEIEHALELIESVDKALVLVKGEGDKKQLCAYIIVEKSALQHDKAYQDYIRALREQLSSYLPDYMLPAAFILLDELPLTANGKVNVNALPQPQAEALQSVYVAPGTEIEIKLAAIWQEVLDVEQVGIADNFFELGGHSLLAIQLVARIEQELHVKFPLQDVFHFPELSAQAKAIESHHGLLSPVQERLWLLDKIEQSGAWLNKQITVELEGKLDCTSVEKALKTIIQRHESLRTCFAEGQDGQAYPMVKSTFDFSCSVFDVSSRDRGDCQQEIRQLLAEDAASTFDLSQDLMLRAKLFKTSSDRHLLLLKLHQIATDAVSVNILFKEFCLLYQAYEQQKPNPLPEVMAQYHDFTKAQHRQLKGKALAAKLNYWQAQLTDLPQLHGLPIKGTRPAVQTFDSESYVSHLNQNTYQALCSLCESLGTGLDAGIHAVFSVLVSRYSNHKDIVIAMPETNREQAKFAGLIGPITNPLVLRSDLSNEPGFASVIQQTQTLLNEARSQQLPFELIVEHLQPIRSTSHSPLFQLMLVLDSETQTGYSLADLKINRVEEQQNVIPYDLILNVCFTRSGITLTWQYNSDLFTAASVASFARHFEHLLGAMLASPDENVFKAELISQTECLQLLTEDKDTVSNDSPFMHIHRQFEQRAEQLADVIALVCSTQQLTYMQLNQRANQLAHYLKGQKQLAPDDLIGVCVERSTDMVVAILAILKAGGAYVPLDPDYPAARLEYILNDAKVTTVITQQSVLARSSVSLPQAVCLDSDDVQAILAEQPTENLTLESLSPHHLAYVIYTSGSTGQPKGVMIEHAQLTNFIGSMKQAPGCDSNDVLLAVTSLSFDIHTLEIFLPLTCGAQVVLATTNEPAQLIALIEQHAVSIMQATPATWKMLVQSQWQPRKDIKLLSGGEALTNGLKNDLLAHSAIELWNMYGPTETCVWSALAQMNREEDVTLGKAIANTNLYVLDDQLLPVPQGVAGELCIGGAGLARGYLNQAELTDEKFIRDPFNAFSQSDGCRRLYKTGDLVRRNAHGKLEYLGRIDHQVKVRGYRIELGEIEHALTLSEQVKDAVAVVREITPGDSRITAYLVPEQESLRMHNDCVSATEMMFDDVYQDVAKEQEIDPYANYASWISSYDNKPIAVNEMNAWRDATVERILALKPKRVLEIGIGSGLLFWKIAPMSESYWGTDLSTAILTNLKNTLQLHPELTNRVELRQQQANDFSHLPQGYFDTIIINSVAQYFPHANYLQDTLSAAAELLAHNGALFIGDVRNLNLLPVFKTAIQTSRAADNSSPQLIQQQVSSAVTYEEELLIAPAFFDAFSRKHSRIKGVFLQAKTHAGDNEMTRHRYDVVLRVDNEALVSAAGFKELVWGEHIADLEQLTSALARHPDDGLRLSKLPNSRIEAEVNLFQTIADYSQVQPLKDLLTRKTSAISIEAIQHCAEQSGYLSYVTLSGDSHDACLDVILVRADSELANAELTDLFYSTLSQDCRPEDFVNNPQLAEQHAHLVEETRTLVKSLLPEYMEPNNYLVLDELPLTPNGKIDRSALPGLEPISVNVQYVAPRNDIEASLCTIWQQLLGVEQVGVTDNFFELGGHSLLATRLVAHVEQELNISIPLREMFDLPDLAALAEAMKHYQTAQGRPVLAPVSRDKVLPLSFAQQRLWLLDNIDGSSALYNMPNALRLDGDLNYQALNQALNAILQRHESLRTCFAVDEQGQPFQVLKSTSVVELGIDDLSSLPSLDKEQCIDDMMAQEATKAFDLSRDLMLRARLLKLAENSHILLVTMHHIASDGWSMGVVVDEFSTLYSAFVRNQSNPLPPLTIQYADYAYWQRSWLQGDVLEKQLSYWENQLAQLPAVHKLPLDKQRPAQQSFAGDNVNSFISVKAHQDLGALCQAQGATLFMGLHAAFSVLLSHYSNETDIVIGSLIANREHAEIAGLIGFFVNTLILRSDLSNAPGFADLVQQSKQTLLDAYAHQHVPFEKIVERLQPERSTSHSPIFQIMLVLQNNEEGTLSLPGLSLSPLTSDAGVAKYDLTLNASETPEGLALRWDYNTDLFNRGSIEQLARHFTALVEALVRSPEQDVFTVNMLTCAEEQWLLEQGRQPSAVPETTLCIHQLFEVQVKRSPEATALTFGTQQLSYQQLNERANQLAYYLKNQYGIGPDTLVGICLERSPDMVIALLAVLKAGGAFVPLDPAYPSARLSYVIADSSLMTVLTHTDILARTPIDEAQAVCLNAPGLIAQLEKLPSDNLSAESLELASHHLAYVIYTSGSTGQPKGVMLEHSGLCNLVVEQRKGFCVTASSRVLQFASFAFDAAISEFMVTLCSGAQLVLASEATIKNIPLLEAYVQQQKVSHATLPPALLPLLDKEKWASVGTLIVAGEACAPVLADRWAKDRILINAYGPSEATVCTTMGQYLAGQARVHIGKPIANNDVYVLNKNEGLVPVGVAGELCISSIGLARGYLNQPQLSAEKFIYNPFSREDGGKNSKRLYKTGDLVRWLPDGNLEFLGRIDHQVKIRGYRIELGEIEQSLIAHQLVKDAVVIAKETAQGAKHLIGYIATAASDEKLPDQLMQALRAQLPDYMIPAMIISLPAIPVTVNGKVDYQALPTPDFAERQVEYVAPRTKTELQLCEIWQDVLGVERVGLHDNFFELGGHSLLGIELSSAIKNKLHVTLTLKSLFQSPTIQLLANEIIKSRLASCGCDELETLLDQFALNSAKTLQIVLTMNLPYTRVFGGANVSNRYLSEAIVDLGHSVKVIAPALAVPSDVTLDQLKAQLEQSGISVQVKANRFVFEVNNVEVHAVFEAGDLPQALVNELSDDVADWVLVSAEDPSQTLFRAALEAQPDKVIYLAHTPQMLPFGKESLYPGKRRAELIGQSQGIVTISDFVAGLVIEEYGQQYGEAKVFTNHPPHYGDDFPVLGDFENAYVLCFNPCEVKGLSIFLGLAEQNPDISFAVVPGWGTTPTHLKEIARYSNITVLEKQPDLNELLKDVKLLLVPSLWSEGFGMVTIDAMTRGIPVIASDLGGLKEAKLGTDYLIPVDPIRGYKEQQDENYLLKTDIPEQDLTQWQAAIQNLYFSEHEYRHQSELARKKALEFVERLNVSPLIDFLNKRSLCKQKVTLNRQQALLQSVDLCRLGTDKLMLIDEQSRQILSKVQPQSEAPIFSMPAQSDYQTSYAQRQLLLVDELSEGFYGYVISGSYTITEDLQIEAFEKACFALIARHESLRTHFVSVEGQYKQVISDEINFNLERIDLRHMQDSQAQYKMCQQYAREMAASEFDLYRDRLIKIRLLQTDAHQYIVQFAMHHIISDAHSLTVVLEDLQYFYALYVENGEDTRPPLTFHYKDFAAWQLQGVEKLEQEKQYWHKKLADVTPLQLPLDHPRPALKTYNGASYLGDIPASLSEQFEQLISHNNASMLMGIIACVKALLSRYTNADSIAVSTPSNGRNHDVLANQVGFYVNMLVLQDQLDLSNDFITLLEQVKTTCLEAYEHQAYPFSLLVENLVKSNDPSRSPLADVMVTLEHHESTQTVRPARENNLSFKPFAIEDERVGSSHDMSFLFVYSHGKLTLEIVYNTDLFNAETITRIHGHFNQLLREVVTQPNKPVNEIELLQSREVSLIESDNYKADFWYPNDLCIHTRFEQMAHLRGQEVALIEADGVTEISYSQLNRKANRLAHYLRELGVRANTVVPVIAEHSADLIAVMLAVLKAGGCYLPVSPAYPAERIQGTLSKSQAKIILAAPDVDINMLINDDETRQCLWITDKAVSAQAEHNPDCINQSSDLAYVIYTSGSTGKPKGVMVKHHNVIRLFLNQSNLFSFSEKDVWTLFHSFCFDFSVWEIYGALLFGGKLVITPAQARKELSLFAKLIERNRVTVLNQVPNVFYNLIEQENFACSKDLALRYVIFGGDSLAPGRLKEFYHYQPQINLINMYGITETSVHSTYKKITEKELTENISNIGRPLPTTSLFVFDDNKKHVPVNVAGELYVGGAGVTAGYLLDPELTAQRFIEDPYNPDRILYKTGDLVKRLTSGEYEYLGRLDNQVKIRGFRIELSEIETQLKQKECVNNVTVLAKTDSSDNKYLVAYINLFSHLAHSESDLVVEFKALLKQSLPDYMIPNAFVFVDDWPLTGNGKIDRKKLLLMEAVSSHSEHLAANTETERKLIQIWSELLDIEASKISVDADFFNLGGHSLLAVKLLARISETWNIKIPIRSMYESASCRTIAVLIDEIVMLSDENLNIDALSEEQLDRYLSLMESYE